MIFSVSFYDVPSKIVIPLHRMDGDLQCVVV